VFIVYITVLPRVDGGHVRWVFVLPALWTLALMDAAERSRCLDVFCTVFAISLVPGIVISLAAFVGLPLTFAGPEPIASRANLSLIHLPGALFILESNHLLMPWGGVLFRMSAIYDEPGTVGTTAAFLLAAYAFRLRDWRVALAYIGGLLSFSLAFLVLAIVGFLLARPFKSMAKLGALPLILAAILATGAWHPSVPASAVSNLTIRSAAGEERKLTGEKGHGRELRGIDTLDNRMDERMSNLVKRYGEADLRTRVFGMGSDASVVKSESATWRRLLTDFGLLGFALFCVAYATLGWALWRRTGYAYGTALFLALCAMSVYQRPVVWMPYALVLLFCGALKAAASDSAIRS
jgi:hypothetical protein